MKISTENQQNLHKNESNQSKKLKEDLKKIDWNKITNVIWNVCDLYWKAKLINEKKEDNEQNN